MKYRQVGKTTTIRIFPERVTWGKVGRKGFNWSSLDPFLQLEVYSSFTIGPRPSGVLNDHHEVWMLKALPKLLCLIPVCNWENFPLSLLRSQS